MDHVKECTSMLIKNVLSATEKSLISAWENQNGNEDFSTEIAKAFEKVQNPFAGLETSYLQTEYMKKNLNYVGYREEVQYCDIHIPYVLVVLNCIYCTQLKKINWHSHIGIMIYQKFNEESFPFSVHALFYLLFDLFGVIICIGHR